MNALPHRPHNQGGMVLLMALVMLLLVTLLGVTSVRMLTVEERMAANSFDRNLAFQAAETALREGEAQAEAQARMVDPLTGDPAPNAGFPAVAMDCNNLNNGACANGLCSPPAAACNGARWEDSPIFNGQPVPPLAAVENGGGGWRNATTAVSPLAVRAAPQFFVEHLGSGFVCDPQEQPPNPPCNGYRITARSHDPALAAAEGRAAVILQSIYIAP